MQSNKTETLTGNTGKPKNYTSRVSNCSEGYVGANCEVGKYGACNLFLEGSGNTEFIGENSHFLTSQKNLIKEKIITKN